MLNSLLIVHVIRFYCLLADQAMPCPVDDFYLLFLKARISQPQLLGINLLRHASFYWVS